MLMAGGFAGEIALAEHRAGACLDNRGIHCPRLVLGVESGPRGSDERQGGAHHEELTHTLSSSEAPDFAPVRRERQGQRYNFMMLNVWRPLAYAAVFHLVFAAVAAAQTVIVTNGPAGQKVEMVLACKPAGSATVDPRGVATIPINLQAATGVREMDARVFVDVCSAVHRIIITERNQLPQGKEENCDRREISGIFWIRHVSTLVVNVGGPIPTMLLTRGKYDPHNPAPPRHVANGLIIFGGGGLTKFDDLIVNACGDVSTCNGDNSGGALTGGAAYWILPWLAAEGSYIRPSELTTTGEGTNFNFSSKFDTHLFTAVANVAIPVRAVRIYAKIGGILSTSTTTTSQTSGEETQSTAIKTQGWGPLFGGGFEGWIKPRFAVYFEAVFGTLKGEPTDRNVEGDMDQGFKYMMGGVRVRLF